MSGRRYEPLFKIASGGTAAVYVGSAVGALGFRQLVAIKRPHAHLADDPAFCAALASEARIASRLHHANVVDVRDVEVDETGIQLVMDYVEGASLSELIRGWSKEPPARPAAVALRIVLDACEGLRAVHELHGDDGADLGLVHRDVSPANVLVGLDGVARIADFGLAKPLLSVERTTSEGALRGKLGYMAPEYIRGKAIDRRIDVFAMGVVLWEALAQKRLFRGENDGETLDRVQQLAPPELAVLAPHLGPAAAALDEVIAHALAKNPDDRLATMDALSRELEAVIRTHDLGATHADVRDAFPPSLKSDLDERRRRIQSAISSPSPSSPPPSLPPSLPPSPSPPPLPSPSPPPRAKPIPAPLLAAIAVVVVALLFGVGVAARRSAAAARAAASSDAPAPTTTSTTAGASSADPHAQAPAPDGSSPWDLPSAADPRAPSRGPRLGTRPPTHPSATSDEPGKKPPRPNPYASSSPPR